MTSKSIVLDANILIRAVLGSKVRGLITANVETIDFFTPDICLIDTQKYLPIIFEKRAIPAEPALKLLGNLASLLHVVDYLIYNMQKRLNFV